MPASYAIPKISSSSGVDRAYPVWPVLEVAGVSAITPAWMAKSLWIEMYGISNYISHRTSQNIPSPDTPSFQSYLDQCMADINVIEG